MPIFYIKHGETGSDRDGWQFVSDRDGNPLEYADGKGAALALEGLREPGERRFWRVPEGHSLFIYREPDAGEGDLLWREREVARFVSGRYKPVPWADDPELTGTPDHFPHIAESNAQKIAFTETEAKGRADKQKVMSAADYLHQFVSGERDKKSYYVSVMLGLSVDVEFASTSDEIEARYIEMAGYSRSDGDYAGVLSCMTYRASHFGGVHPVRVYGAGDLSLAYLRASEGGSEDTPAPIIARALVWPEKAICGRVYGPGAATLRGALRAQGFARFDDCALTGARLLAIPHDSGNSNCYVMPYIDGYHHFRWHSNGEDFVISEGGFRADSTGGYAYTYKTCECERCGDEVNETETRTVDDETWCNHCANNYSFTCEHCDVSSSGSNSEVIVNSYRNVTGRLRFNYETWCEDCCDNSATYSENHSHYIADEHGETCDHCSEFFVPDQLRDDDARRVCGDCHESLHENDDDDDDDAPALPVPDPAPVDAPAAPPSPAFAADVPRIGCPCHICEAARREGLPERNADGSPITPPEPVRMYRATFGDGDTFTIPARSIVWDEIAPPRPFPQWVLTSATE